jgi:quinate dehydrogenase
VIGGGATTRSAVYALMTLGLSPIFLINRDNEEVRMVMENFESMGVDKPELIHLKSVEDIDQCLGNGSTKGEKPELAIVVGAIPGL